MIAEVIMSKADFTSDDMVTLLPSGKLWVWIVPSTMSEERFWTNYAGHQQIWSSWKLDMGGYAWRLDGSWRFLVIRLYLLLYLHISLQHLIPQNKEISQACLIFLLLVKFFSFFGFKKNTTEDIMTPLNLGLSLRNISCMYVFYDTYQILIKRYKKVSVNM